MSSLQACLFDLDGVIVDTAKYHYLAWRHMAQQLGFDLSETQNEQLKGISRMESLDIILRLGGVVLDQDTKEQLASEKNQHYLELCAQITPQEVLPGVLDFMNEVRRAGIKIGLGSASKNARLILQHLDMLPYFDTIVDGTLISRGKPDPQTFALGAADLRVPAAACVVFEDAVAGVEAARAAGMKAVGVGDPEVLAAADRVIPGFKDFSLHDLMTLFQK
ncbi:beta-phosphoglucomutase [Rhabdobacter roseus]|uniref:Beta-phosphoglucomutase n=1 Tax=Rhabdobacter roseus TaxID=1655419 RepID=A0A840TIQ4_9BACT|nr:beta-phosphoglucomutase [Rhabdobacter roseus]MBB5283334.1 beta-phosphoglucomutase [Rhabdobacter roseus]